jgi:4-diphosphocytidyl-2-C-methyl-D-erythritol kinase
MIFSSYAKINLNLKVNSKSKNSLHEIQSYFCLINLADKIQLKKNKKNKDIITFRGPFAKLVNKSNNTIFTLLKLLRKLRLLSNFYTITVTKNIPVYAGLGGGTSNAAAIFKYLLKKKINKSLIKKVENKTGSDFKLFFYKQGFLKNLRSIIDLKKKQKIFFVLIQPLVKCSTREIYSRVRNYSRKKKLEKNEINTRLKLFNYLANSSNELQSIVEKKYPIVKELLANMEIEKGCHFSRITGSGSVCYGIFNNQFEAKKALNNLKIKYPKFWVALAKTV